MNPLDQLADITSPQSISVWPLAWGYYVVIVLVLALLALAVYGFMAFKTRRKAKYAALTKLNKIDIQEPYFAHKVQVVLKNLMTHYMPQIVSKTMHGNEWQALLLYVYRGKQTTRFEQTMLILQQRMYANTEQLSLLNQGVSVEADAQTTASAATTEQNQQILNAVKEFVSTSFPCKTASNDNAAANISARTKFITAQKAHNV